MNGIPYFIAYQNTGRFKSNEFGDKSIKKESVITERRSNGENQWTETKINHNLLADQTELLQIGNVEETEFFSFNNVEAK